jgi:ATP-dependent helicase/nuclease subunit B
MAALDWVDGRVSEMREQHGRTVLKSEIWGETTIRGVRIRARADRIDRLEDGGLAIVDYKTGQPPSRKMVKQGFSLQLGLVGLIAAKGGFEGVSGEPAEFEYWSLAKDQKRRAENGFGYCCEPFATDRADGVAKEDFLRVTADYLDDAITRWIVGDDPFTARLNPDLPSYTDYDQLMRLDEWLPHMTREEAEEG